MKSKTYKKPIKVGTIPLYIAKKMGGTSCDVEIDYSHVTHISNDHLQQIKNAGFSPTLFIKTVVENFNTIYIGSITDDGCKSYVLAVYDIPLSNVAAVTLERTGNKWIVRTAYPVKAAQIRRYKDRIIWTKEPTLKAEGG